MHVKDDTKHDPSCDATGHCFSRYVDDTASPLWPFGHGLTYTTYEYVVPFICFCKRWKALGFTGNRKTASDHCSCSFRVKIPTHIDVASFDCNKTLMTVVSDLILSLFYVTIYFGNALHRYINVTATVEPVWGELPRTLASPCGSQTPVLLINVRVANTGPVDGTEVVQA